MRRKCDIPPQESLLLDYLEGGEKKAGFVTKYQAALQTSLYGDVIMITLFTPAETSVAVTTVYMYIDVIHM